MARGRPRGNRTQRDIGRAVGKGLGSLNNGSNGKSGCLIVPLILLVLFVIFWVTSGFTEAVMMMEVVTVVVIVLALFLGLF